MDESEREKGEGKQRKEGERGQTKPRQKADAQTHSEWEQEAALVKRSLEKK